MPWFRVDDTFDQHPKVDAAGNRAIGLWVRAGAYSARLLTEGFVPSNMVGRLGGTRKDAEALVEVGLWHAVEGGYRFHEWSERQPSKAQVEADRKAAAERQRRARERARESRRDTPPESRRDEDDPSRRESRSPRPGPAQTPYLLTLVGRLAGGNAHERGGLPAEQIDAWQELAGPDVDLVAEARAYLAHHADRPAHDERAAWLGWLRKARTRAGVRLGCDDPDCIGGWLPPDEHEIPRPCRKCRPHLRPAEEAS